MTCDRRQNLKKTASGIAFLLLGFFLFSQALAGTLNQFELNDGSVILGKVLSYSQGVYKIDSDVLGTISLPENKIRTIKPSGRTDPDPQSPARQEPPNTVDIDQMQEQMMSDPETVRLIQKLQNDPSVQEILQDQELMEAISQGNLNRVGTDPKIKELMKNESVGKIIEKNQ